MLFTTAVNPPGKSTSNLRSRAQPIKSSLWPTHRVLRPRKDRKRPQQSLRLRTKSNLVAVISNGTAVLAWATSVEASSRMEERAICLNNSRINVFDIELNCKDPDQVIAAVKALEPTFGGINLEDIKAPECFYIESELKKHMNIPVFHDDQHGTAIISAAALVNACMIAKKDITKIKLVINGAGAAAVACGRLFMSWA